MKKRKLGGSDLFVSELGLGCMSLGTDKKQAENIIAAALDQGVNYFDTADLYDFGENEKLVGQALKPVRSEVIIATKGGNRWNDNKDSWSWDASPAYLKEAVKSSLLRLGTDYIDLYQLHGGMIEDDIPGVIGTFEDLKKEGLIRYYGISSIRPNVIKRYTAESNIDSVMMQFSLLDRRPEEWLPLLNNHQVSVIARGPVAKGLLSEKMLEKAGDDGYLDYSLQDLEQVLPSIKEQLSGRKMNEIALRYVLAHPETATVAAGASSPEQLIENARAVMAKPLSEQEIELLKKLTKPGQYDAHRD